MVHFVSPREVWRTIIGASTIENGVLKAGALGVGKDIASTLVRGLRHEQYKCVWDRSIRLCIDFDAGVKKPPRRGGFVC